SLKTLYRKRTVIWPFYFYTIIRTLSVFSNPNNSMIIKSKITDAMQAKKIKRHRQNEFIFILNDSKKEINEHNKNLLHENYISTIDYSELDEKIGLLI
ncbi:DUF1829 domain-containing protein, partial [Staphylococcus aureus]|nr:DUF1829 domain-containing protein [Staphylococcus aureus]